VKPRTTARKTIRKSAMTALRPRAKVWLEVGDEYVFGHGLCEILEAVDEVGSIKQAASQMGKSYRHIWSRIKEAEKAIGESLVDAHVGGAGAQRSEITARARQLMDAFIELRQAVFDLVEREFASRRTGFLGRSP
jgi:molybdate transport system regulatory protein